MYNLQHALIANSFLPFLLMIWTYKCSVKSFYLHFWSFCLHLFLFTILAQNPSWGRGQELCVLIGWWVFDRQLLDLNVPYWNKWRNGSCMFFLSFFFFFLSGNTLQLFKLSWWQFLNAVSSMSTEESYGMKHLLTGLFLLCTFSSFSHAKRKVKNLFVIDFGLIVFSVCGQLWLLGWHNFFCLTHMRIIGALNLFDVCSCFTWSWRCHLLFTSVRGFLFHFSEIILVVFAS